MGHRVLHFVILLATGLPLVARAQSPSDSGRVVGRLIGPESTPIGRGTIQVRGRRGLLLLDGQGNFELHGLAPGRYVLIAKALGFDSATAEVLVGAAPTPPMTITLPPLPQVLPEVVVEEESRLPSAHVAGFERRRAAGRGSYITREDIDREHPQNLQALLLQVPGVRLDCRGRSCILILARTASQRLCEPQYFLDGVPTDPLMVGSSLYHVYGVEVYRRQSETPQEFRPAEAPCGVVAVWTRGRW